MEKMNKTKRLFALVSILAVCIAVSVLAQPMPSTPFVIHGYVFYDDGSECKNPLINITNLNSGAKWQAETNESSNYYQLVLASGTSVNASEILLFDVKSPDESQLNITHRNVTLEDINRGGIFDFNITLEVPQVLQIFDTGKPANPYPSIFGTHNGSITPYVTIYNVSKLYTYSCPGTGGHTEYVAFYYDPNRTEIITEGHWNGYTGDWHNITISPSFTMQAYHTYYYTVRTGSYPQIHHADEREAEEGMGIINCTSFVDANGKLYNNWIPAIRLEGSVEDVWSEDIRITNDTAYSMDPEIAVDSDDDIHITWRDSSGIYYTKLDNNGTTLVDDKKLSTGNLSEIAVDSNNNAHITWWDSGICYMKLDGNGSILVDKKISAGGEYYCPTIALDSNDNVHITWFGVYYTKLDNNGTILVDTKRLTTAGTQPAITVDLYDDVWITWYNNHKIYYTKLDNNGSVLINDTKLSDDKENSINPKIAADLDNNVHITWCDFLPPPEPCQTSQGTQGYFDYIHYMKLDSNGSILVTDTRIATGVFPAIATDSNNNIHIAWNDIGGAQIYYMKLDSKGNPLIDDMQLTTGGRPAIAVDSNNKAHVTWEDNREGNGEIYYKRQR